MKIDTLRHMIPQKICSLVEDLGISEFRPCQHKAVSAGLFEFQNLLICTPTASGKTLVAEMAALNSIMNRVGKVIYIVPLKALASEKHEEFTKRYGHLFSIAKSIGDSDSPEEYLAKYDLVITTSEKLDSLMRHQANWIKDVKVVIIDEIHQLNDTDRGPTLEIVITILRSLLKNIQIIGLSATIGNPQDLANWLDAKLVQDDWRPVKLHKGVMFEGKIEFFETKTSM